MGKVLEDKLKKFSLLKTIFFFSEPPQVPPRNIILKPESVYEEIDQINLQERPIKKANTIDIRNTISQWYDDASDEIERDLSLGEKSNLIKFDLI